MSNVLRTKDVAFMVYLALLFAISFPLGSNRDWIWPFFSTSILLLLVVLTLTDDTLTDVVNTYRWPVLGFTLLLAWILVQTTGIPLLFEQITVDAYSTFKALLKTITYFGFYLLTIHLVCSQTRVTVVVYTVVMAALAQGILGVYGVLLGLEPDAHGTFPNPNHFAGFLEMAIGLGIGMMMALLSPKQHGKRMLGWMETVAGPKGRLRLILIILVIGLVMSTSRMGNIALFTAIIVVGLVFSYVTRKLNRMVIVFLFSVLVIDAAIIGNYFGLDRISQRVQNLTLQTEMRDELNLVNLGIIKDNLIAGTGAGTFVHVFPQYRTAEIKVHFTHAENDYFEFLLELGIVGAIPLCIVLVFSIRMQLRLLSNRETQYVQGIAFGCMLGTVSLLIHAMADFNLRIPSNALLFVLLLALPLALEHQKPANAP
jgi:O-antigen ligase